MQPNDSLQQNPDPGEDAPPAPTAASIAIFAVVVALLFGGMYLFLPDSYRPAPTVAQKPAPDAPVTTGQGSK
jgi:hypothetical protein